MSHVTALFWMRFTLIAVALYAAASAVAWLIADSMIFFPNYASRDEPRGSVRLRLEDGTFVSAIFLPRTEARHTIWYFHGNAEALDDILPRLHELNLAGFSVFAVEYPGYGASGGSPGEKQIYATLSAGIEFLRTEKKVQLEDTLVYGRSLGGGPAVELASREPVAALILESTFVSAYRVMTRWPILVGDRFKNLRKLSRISCPLLVIHGRDDRTIPFWHGERLYAAAPSRLKNHLWVDLAGHNDVRRWAGDSYQQAITQFASKL